MANLATKSGVEGGGIKVHAPLQFLSKGQIVSEGVRTGVDFGLTVSCYNADANGAACGHCDACRLRAQGFAEAGVPDPRCTSEVMGLMPQWWSANRWFVLSVPALPAAGVW